MRIIIFLLGCLLLVSCKPNKATPEALVYQLKYPLAKTMVSGHRGAKAYDNYPENCLETFKYLRDKVDCIIECDVASTKDGVLVLLHDDALDRTTNGTGRIDRRTFDEVRDLQLLDAAGTLTDYRIPKFNEVLVWAEKTNTMLSVDIKKSVRPFEVIKAIRKNEAAANCMLISYSLKQSKEMYRLAPEMMQSISIRNEQELARWETAGIPANRTIAFTGTKRSPKKLYDELHKRGIACIFGTLGNIDKQAAAKGPKVYKDLIEIGVDILATDRPLEAAAAIGE